MLNNRHLNGELHPVVASGARDMLDRYESERTGVLSTTKSFLSLYRDPVIAGNVSRSDFRIADLMNSDRPVTLYLTVRAEDKDRMRPLMRLIINQLVRVLLRPELKFENGRQLPPHKHRLCILLDEFPSYGRLDVFQEALAYIAGYGIKAYLIMQDIEQLYSTYTKHETIISNCPRPGGLRPEQDRDGRLDIEEHRRQDRDYGRDFHLRPPFRHIPAKRVAHVPGGEPPVAHTRRSDAAQGTGQERARPDRRARRGGDLRRWSCTDPRNAKSLLPRPGIQPPGQHFGTVHGPGGSPERDSLS